MPSAGEGRPRSQVGVAELPVLPFEAPAVRLGPQSEEQSQLVLHEVGPGLDVREGHAERQVVVDELMPAVIPKRTTLREIVLTPKLLLKEWLQR